MQQLFKLVERVAGTDSTVLIQGESGTGKELIARAIHRVSPRRDQPLIPVNCGAIPEDLLESELFGHVKGSFTGAANNRPGRFVLADGGTLFLDEIGDMSPKLQVKMLRVLQEKVVEPVGAVAPVNVNVRVIAATHKNLEQEVRVGRFREDLFYRLNVVPLDVPPLRDRKSDIAALVEFFIAKYARQSNREMVALGADAIEIFRRYRWPGNVRELENLINRLTILCDGVVKVDDLPARMLDGENLSAPMPEVDEVVPAAAFAVTLPLDGDDPLDFNQEVESFENRLILSALERTGWNKNQAARMLGLNRTTLVEKIKKKGLEQRMDPN